MKNWEQRASALHHKSVGYRWDVNSEEDKRFLALALSGEVGELANFVKKVWRGDHVPTIAIWKELADIRIYLHLLSVAYGCDLDGMCSDKLDEFEKRLNANR